MVALSNGHSMSEARTRSNPGLPHRRGRPQKFGRPGHVVSVTLPEDALESLSRVDPDTGWAIVKLLERDPRGGRKEVLPRDVELARISGRRSLIVVSRAAFRNLQGVSLVPIDERRAFVALEVGRGMGDLELAVIDGLSDGRVLPQERKALEGLRRQLAAWRRDRRLVFHTRSIIVVEEEGPARRPPRRGARETAVAPS